MALVLADRVQQTGTANTTVSFTLSGSVTGYQSFAVVGNGNTTYYAATDGSVNWEVGIGTYSTTGPTLTRTTILSSSNSGSAVTFSGTVNVFVTYPSEKSVNLDGSGNVSALGTVSSGVWQGTAVAVGYGGTGLTTLTAGYIPYGNGTSAFSSSANMTFNGSTLTTLNSAYTGTLTGGTGIVNLGSGQFYKDASGNVGIGTSSPADKLEVYSTITARTGSGTSALRLRNTTSDYQWQTVSGTNAVALFDNAAGSARLTLDSSGNLGLGVTPSAWAGTANKAMQINNLTMGQNIGFDVSVLTTNGYATGSTTYNYIGSASAGQYQFGGGGHRWYVAPSGTAGNAITFTQAMTLDSSGNLGIANTSMGQKLAVNGGIQTNGTATLGTGFGGGAVLSFENPISRMYFGDGTGYSLAFSKRASSTTTDLMTLTDSGNVGIGTSSPAVKLDILGSTPFVRLQENTTGYLGFKGQNTSGNFYFGIDSSTGVFYGSAYARVLYSDGAYPMVFYTNATERMRIDSSGNVGIGTASPASLLHVDNGLITSQRYSSAAAIVLRSAAGTQASPTAIASSTGLSTIVGRGYDGSAYRDAALIQFYSDGAISSTSSPGFITFGTTPSGSVSTTERMRIDSSGNLLVGTTTNTNSSKVVSSGVIESTTGGFRFPDGTTQTTAAYMGANNCLFENNMTITANYTITTGRSASSVGPITIASGKAVTIPSGSRWVIL